MVSTWSELLCVGFGKTRSYRLYLGIYEVLGEVAEYYDEELDEFSVPDIINGKAVQGVKDDYVVGFWVEDAGYRPDDEFEFDTPSECVDWLTETQWLDDRLLADLTAALAKLGEPKFGIDIPDSSISRY
jgi:hypothetical protein